MTDTHRIALRNLYDQHMRRDSWVLAFDKTLTPDTSRYVASNGEAALLMWHQFSASNLAQRVDEELAWFKARAKSLNWKVYGHDEPAELGAALTAAGGESEDHATLYMAQVAQVCAQLAGDKADISLVAGSTRTDVMRAQAVWVDVWPESAAEQRVWGEVYAYALDQLADSTPDQQGAMFWAASNPSTTEAPAIGAGYMIHGPGTPVALLCGGAVREAYRGQGVYKALLKARAEWALSRGAKFIAIEASPLSAPIVEALGFEPITSLVFYKFDF